MLNRLSFLLPVILLSACAYALDGAIQDIKIVTPGAKDAVCYMYVEGARYRLRPPETTNISKSSEDLIVDCLAPGNRRKKVVIEADIVPAFTRNTNFPPGAVWDYASKAMFAYPSVVTVDFTDAVVKPEELPAQNNPDIKQPEEYFLEEFRPSVPRMNDDRYKMPTEIKRRQKPSAPGYAESYITEGSGQTKGDLEKSGGALPPGPESPGVDPSSLNPAGDSSVVPPAADGPIPLYPGQ